MRLVFGFLVLLHQHTYCKPLQDSTLGLNEIIWQPEKTEIYIGSPSIQRHPKTAEYVASADRFGHGSWQGNVSIFHSHNGIDWNLTTWAVNNYWANLHYNETTDTLYLLGGNPEIRLHESKDFGRTWKGATVMTAPKGYGFAGGPTPQLYSNGRIFRGYEYTAEPIKWPFTFEATLLWAHQGADLLDATSWHKAQPVPWNNSWIPASWAPTRPLKPGYLEGNAVEAPSGDVYNILRVNSLPYAGNYAAALKFDMNTNTLTFDTLIKLPGGHTKFVIRRDPQTGYYYTLSNYNHDPIYTDQRNILVFCVSKDMFNWDILTTLLMDDTGVPLPISIAFTGFHYVDWIFNGDNIDYVIRTGYRGSNSYHNSNRMTIKTIHNFRDMKVDTLADFSLTGSGYEVRTYRDGESVFTNRGYYWKDVDPTLEAAKLSFTSIAGGEENHTNVHFDITVHSTGVIYIVATPPAYWNRGGNGVHPNPWRFTNYAARYDDTHDTWMNVYALPVDAGHMVHLDQVNCGWAGCLVLGKF